MCKKGRESQCVCVCVGQKAGMGGQLDFTVLCVKAQSEGGRREDYSWYSDGGLELLKGCWFRLGHMEPTQTDFSEGIYRSVYYCVVKLCPSRKLIYITIGKADILKSNTVSVCVSLRVYACLPLASLYSLCRCRISLYPLLLLQHVRCLWKYCCCSLFHFSTPSTMSPCTHAHEPMHSPSSPAVPVPLK